MSAELPVEVLLARVENAEVELRSLRRALYFAQQECPHPDVEVFPGNGKEEPAVEQCRVCKKIGASLNSPQ